MLKGSGKLEESARRLETGLDRPMLGLVAYQIEGIGKTYGLFMRVSELGFTLSPITGGQR